MQDTNLKISPYFDDFDRTKNYQKVLFKPGYSVQTRELNSLQSSLQNQIERFGQHVFKDGSVVIPGNINYRVDHKAVLVQSLINGIPVENYRESLVGKTLSGTISGVKAEVIGTISEAESEKDTLTLYVRYTAGGIIENNEQVNFFKNNEILVDETGTQVAVTTVQDATSYTASIAYITAGVYFIRGFFVEVAEQSIILDQYSNRPTYKVGLQVIETINTVEEDDTLYDNAIGTSNYSSPGADRLKIEAVLVKQNLLFTDDSNFIELLRLEDGTPTNIVDNTKYNELEKNLARRTFDESGSYALKPYGVKIREALNNGTNNGVYNVNDVLPDGRTIVNEIGPGTPENSIKGSDYYAVEISEGKAYVKGFEVKNDRKQYVVVPKPRKTISSNNQSLLLGIGSYLKVDSTQTLKGSIVQHNKVELRDADNTQIGEATVLGLTGEYRLFVTDVTIFETYTLSGSHNFTAGDFVTGNVSGSTAFIHAVAGQNITVRQITGSFIVGDGLVNSRYWNGTLPTINTIAKSKLENTRKVTRTVGSTVQFEASIDLDVVKLSGSSFTVSGSTSLTGISTKFLTELSDKSKLLIGSTQVEVSTVSSTTVTLDSAVTNGTYYNVSKLITKLYSSDSGLTVRASTSPLKDSSDYRHERLNYAGQYTVNSSGGFTISIGDAIDSSTIIITTISGEVNATLNQTAINTVEVTGTGLSAGTSVNVYYKSIVSNPSVRTKTKRSFAVIEVNKQSDPTNTIYGTRFSDKEISLKFPDAIKVHAIHQAVRASDTAVDLVDKVVLNDSSNINKGDVFTSGSVVATVIGIGSSNTLYVKYSGERLVNGTNLAITINFINNPNIVGRYVTSSTYGRYIDITDDFNFSRNDTDNYYRVSKIVRKPTAGIPTSKIIVVYDYFEHSNLGNDFYSVESYGNIEYGEIPKSHKLVPLADLIDFRYRVQPSGGSQTGELNSPYIETSTGSPFNFSLATYGASSVDKVPYPSGFFSADLEIYLGRVDKVYLTVDGNGKVVTGSDSKQPNLSEDNSAGMLLATIKLPPYLRNVKDASITVERNKGYTMKDIGALEKRLETVELYTSLSLLESNTINMNVLDENGNNRFKNGFVVDSFSSTTVADLENPDFSASIDLDKKLMRPYPYVANVEFNYNSSQSTVKESGNYLTIPFEEVSYITQNYASRVENVTPFLVSTFIGEMEVTPKKDIWYDTIREVIEGDTIDLTTPFTTLFDIVVPTGTIWNEWVLGGGGARRGGGGTTITDIRSGTSYEVGNLSFDLESGDTIESVTDIPYTRSRIIDISTKGLKPSTKFNFQINETPADSFVYPKLIKNLTETTGTFIIGETVELRPNTATDVIRCYLYNPNQSIRARVVNPLVYSSPSNLPDNSFVNGSYTNSTQVIALDNLTTIDGTNLNPVNLGANFTIRGLTSGAKTVARGDLSLYSNILGELDAFVILPGERYETGDLTLSLSDREDGAQIKGLNGSYATGYYYSQGTELSVSSTLTTIEAPEVSATAVQDSRTRFIPDPPPPPPPARAGDPLAQSFSVNSEGGIYATSIDLFFLTKDDTLPVDVEIRVMNNGFPTEEKVPGSSVVVNASDVKVSDDASVSTRFSFKKPIYLTDQAEYAFVVHSASKKYNMWVSRLAETDVTTGFIIDEQPAVGTLLKSSNGSTWIADPYEDVKFVLNRARFTTNQTFRAVLNNKPIQDSKLINNPLSFTDSSTIIRVFHPNHGMHVTNSKVRISGVVSDTSNAILNGSISGNSTADISLLDVTKSAFNPATIEGWNTINNAAVSDANPGFIRIEDEIIRYTGISNDKLTGVTRGQFNTTTVSHPSNSIVQCFNLNGVPLNQLNTTHSITNVISLDEYEITVASYANSSKKSGGSVVRASKNIQYENIYPKFNTFVPVETNLEIQLNSVSGTSIGNTSIQQQSFVQRPNEGINNLSENELSDPRLVLSEVNRVAFAGSSVGSLNTIINMSTTVDTLSPEIDIDGSSVVLVSNRINKELDSNNNIDISSELLPTGGKHSAYITKKVVLDNSATSVKVMFDAIRTSINDIKVFVKIKGDSNTDSFNDMNYIELTSLSYPTSTTTSEYRAFDFEIDGLKEFKEFSVKLVMIGNNQQEVPKIKNLRCIALAI